MHTNGLGQSPEITALRTDSTLNPILEDLIDGSTGVWWCQPATIPARARARMIGPLKSPLTSAVKERPPAKERPKPRRIPGRGPAVSASQDEETATETADEETVTETADEEAGIVPVEARK